MHRLPAERAREHKYRCAQAIVFGLPVLALQLFGRSLGGNPEESQRWIAIFQALLAGWVLYTGATGMLIDGLVLLRKGYWGDVAIALIAIGLYMWSVGAVLWILLTGHLGYRPLLFHWMVAVIAVWAGMQWWRWGRRVTRTRPPPPATPAPASARSSASRRRIA